MNAIYLDHAATSPTHPEVVKQMLSTYTNVYGNPSSIHGFGREARYLVDKARTTLAKSIGASHNEIIFTSGGTEADNLALVGVSTALKQIGNHIITTSVEHHAILHTCQQLEKQGFDVTYLPVNEDGVLSLQQVKQALREDTVLVSVMFGNNEVGSIQPIKEIGELLQHHPAYFHTDAVQAYGTVDIDVNQLHLDLMSVSGHKINGPKGIGFLYVKEDTPLSPQLFGGEQERKRRAGTENLPGIVGLAKAATLSMKASQEKRESYQEMKDTLKNILTEEDVTFFQNGCLETSLPHVLNLSFPGTDVESLLVNLDMEGIAVSSGSACTAGSIEPSHVLVAMFGEKSDRVRNSIRYSFGLNNTLEDVEFAARKSAKIIHRLTSI
ncbi:cysteine desulfurase family protein [Bacillus sp. 2205SS5-2]|uniref:cysteine desulfurase family protein n=1 Tax=Bacillus sp. 2205SS5-2 TaxID=3109031 RepID=UPI003006924A